MRAGRLIAGILSLALLGACMRHSVRIVHAPPPPKPVGAPMACLAMSGGGIRSGSVSLGALQELYARNVLSRYDMISTVSGGGYPVYGLLYRMIQNGFPLRDLLRERGAFIADVERNAGIVKIGPKLVEEVLLQSVGLPLSWVGRPYASAQPGYIAAIHENFAGGPLSRFGRPTLDRAKELLEVEGFPLPIFGTAASDGATPPQSGIKYTYGHFFALSPFGSGSPVFGEFPDLAHQVSLGQAIASSAAALDTPQDEMQMPWILKAMNLGFGASFEATSASGQKAHFFLADGGFIENLGVLPLLRRGCTDILAFENSDDSAKPFEVWKLLEKHLGEEPGWRISAPLRSAQTGEAPDVVAKDEDRWNMPDHVWDAELTKGTQRVHIRLVKLGVVEAKLQTYPVDTMTFARQNWGDRPRRCEGNGLWKRCPFPLEATGRQGFNPQEFRAYRQLGRWLARHALCVPPPVFERNHENSAADVDGGAVAATAGLREFCARNAAATGPAEF